MSIQNNNSGIQQILLNSPGYLLSAASRTLRAQQAAVLEPLGLSLYEYVILRLVGLKVKLSQGSLGNTYGIDPATMVSLIDRLEEQQLLLRERNPQDRRRYLLRLTPGGTKLLSRAKIAVTKVQNQFLSPLTEQEWESLRNSLWKLLQTGDEHHIVSE